MSPVLAFALGGPELIIVAMIALLLFGGRIPSIMRSLGQSVTSFKKGLNDDEEATDDKVDQKK